MKDKRHPATTTDHDTVLAHLNDPAPTVESPEESEKQDRHEQLDDRTVLAHINEPAKADDPSDHGG